MSFANISFILHKPQLSENIGACARALKNFNFKKLVIINPKPIFPNDKIIATSVGAKDIIKNSRVYETLELAIKKVDFVIATTSRFRNKNIKHIKLFIVLRSAIHGRMVMKCQRTLRISCHNIIWKFKIKHIH